MFPVIPYPYAAATDSEEIELCLRLLRDLASPVPALGDELAQAVELMCGMLRGMCSDADNAEGYTRARLTRVCFTALSACRADSGGVSEQRLSAGLSDIFCMLLSPAVAAGRLSADTIQRSTIRAAVCHAVTGTAALLPPPAAEGRNAARALSACIEQCDRLVVRRILDRKRAALEVRLGEKLSDGLCKGPVRGSGVYERFLADGDPVWLASGESELLFRMDTALLLASGLADRDTVTAALFCPLSRGAVPGADALSPRAASLVSEVSVLESRLYSTDETAPGDFDRPFDRDLLHITSARALCRLCGSRLLDLAGLFSAGMCADFIDLLIKNDARCFVRALLDELMELGLLLRVPGDRGAAVAVPASASSPEDVRRLRGQLGGLYRSAVSLYAAQIVSLLRLVEKICAPDGEPASAGFRCRVRHNSFTSFELCTMLTALRESRPGLLRTLSASRLIGHKTVPLADILVILDGGSEKRLDALVPVFVSASLTELNNAGFVITRCESHPFNRARRADGAARVHCLYVEDVCLNAFRITLITEDQYGLSLCSDDAARSSGSFIRRLARSGAYTFSEGTTILDLAFAALDRDSFWRIESFTINGEQVAPGTRLTPDCRCDFTFSDSMTVSFDWTGQCSSAETAEAVFEGLRRRYEPQT